MWFKLFVLLRIPISAFCLFGCAMLLQGAGAFGGIVLLGMLAFLVFVSRRLVQFHKEALGLAGALLLLELVGGVLIMAMGNYLGFREFDSLTFAVMAGGWSGLDSAERVGSLLSAGQVHRTGDKGAGLVTRLLCSRNCGLKLRV